jgi:hypothetical protein
MMGRGIVKFTVTDVFGQTVVGSFSAWDHLQRRHPEMAGRENDVRAAIERPVSVHVGQTNADRLFRGERFQSGFWTGNFPVVVVTYSGSAGLGFLNTAYLSTLEPVGALLWPKK